MIHKLTIGDRTRIHGMYKHPAHGVWMSMKNRCYLETDQAYQNYGTRGITVCKTWKNSFAAFWKDMGPTYQPKLTLERRKNNKGYSKTNCYWATRLQQGRNKRSNHLIKTPWGIICLSEASERSGIYIKTLRRRIRNWPPDKWFEPPNSSRRYVAYGCAK